MPTPQLSNDVLEEAVRAFYDCRGNKAEAARSLELKRQTYDSRLDMARDRLGFDPARKIADGTKDPDRASALPLPKRGKSNWYLLTSAQNNTHLHDGWNNLLALADWLSDRSDVDTARIIVGTFSYQVAAYGPKAVKRGTYSRRKANEDLWYDPAIEGFILDEPTQLAPGLTWCGELNILPTRKHPLSDLARYNGRQSNVVPHVKQHLVSVASMADEPAKLNMSTGTVTLRNYIQKHAGQVAAWDHRYGALLVRVADDGSWFPHHICIAEDDSIQWVGPEGCGGLYVQAGLVRERPVVASVVYGDAHVAEMDRVVREACWGPGGMTDQLHPRYQVVHDVFSMRHRSPHEERKPLVRYRRLVEGQDAVEDEVEATRDFLNEAARDGVRTVVVHSNHDRHLDRWLDESDYRLDPLNARYFLELQLARYRAVEHGEQDFNLLEHALTASGLDTDRVYMMGQDEGLVIAGVEHGLHGDAGPNGSRGSTRSLAQLGRPINKGHDHTATLLDDVASAGACAPRFDYMMGPSAHSVAHIITYENGHRSLVVMWGGRWR